MLRSHSRRHFLRNAALFGAGLALGTLDACGPERNQPLAVPSAKPTTAPEPSPTIPASETPSPTPSPRPTATAVDVPSPTAMPQPSTAPGPLVGVVRNKDVDRAVRAAVDNAGGLGQVIKPARRVLLKVNLTYPSPSGGGVVTNREVLRSMIKLCQEHGGQVVVADGTGSTNGNTMVEFEAAGYEEIIRETGAQFFDLNAYPSVTRRLPAGLGASEYLVSRLLDEIDVLISMPVLKTCAQNLGVTLSIKNLMGLTPCDSEGTYRKQLHQQGITESLVDLGRLQKIDFALIDGTVGLEGNGPIFGDPVPMDLIIAGADALAVDAVGAAVMGFQPDSIDYLSRLAGYGLGSLDLNRIVVRGNTIAEVRRDFKRPSEDGPT